MNYIEMRNYNLSDCWCDNTSPWLLLLSFRYHQQDISWVYRHAGGIVVISRMCIMVSVILLFLDLLYRGGGAVSNRAINTTDIDIWRTEDHQELMRVRLYTTIPPEELLLLIFDHVAGDDRGILRNFMAINRVFRARGIREYFQLVVITADTADI